MRKEISVINVINVTNVTNDTNVTNVINVIKKIPNANRPPYMQHAAHATPHLLIQ